MAKKITIHAGHNKAGKLGAGASDYIDESTEARLMKRKIRKQLTKLGITSYDCTVNNGTSQNDVLTKIIKKVNAIVGRSYDISIHFNSTVTHSKSDGKTKGIEVWVYDINNKKVRKMAENICKRVSTATGLTNRGVKESKTLYFLKNSAKPALLIEICFVDDQDDVKIYKKNKDVIAKAIAEAISASF